MGWDASRPVAWQRMVREWLVYVAIMAVVFLIFFSDSNLIGVFAGLLASGPIYLAFGYVLAKFGYQRRSLSELRAESAGRGRTRDGRTRDGRTRDSRTRDSRTRGGDEASGAAGPRRKPAPTRRTGGGSSRPGGARRKR